MGDLLDDTNNSLKGKRFKILPDDLPVLIAKCVSLHAYCSALEKFMISYLSDQKGIAYEQLKGEFDELLAQSNADAFSEFLSDPKRDMS